MPRDVNLTRVMSTLHGRQGHICQAVIPDIPDEAVHACAVSSCLIRCRRAKQLLCLLSLNRLRHI